MASPFASDSSIVILNAPTLNQDGSPDVFFTKRTGTLPSGKVRAPRYTVEIRSEPILFDFDETNIGMEFAEAYRQVISDQIRLISEPVKAATVRFRAGALNAWNFGSDWAVQRYSGGRIGPMPPNPNSRTKFNDSGRLAKGVFVRQNPKDKTFTINLPTNRFNPEISGMATVMQWFSDLQRLVPALDPKKAAQLPAIKAASDRAIKGMISKAQDERMARLLHQKAMARNRAIKALAAGLVEVASP